MQKSVQTSIRPRKEQASGWKTSAKRNRIRKSKLKRENDFDNRKFLQRQDKHAEGENRQWEVRKEDRIGGIKESTCPNEEGARWSEEKGGTKVYSIAIIGRW